AAGGSGSRCNAIRTIKTGWMHGCGLSPPRQAADAVQRVFVGKVSFRASGADSRHRVCGRHAHETFTSLQNNDLKVSWWNFQKNLKVRSTRVSASSTWKGFSHERDASDGTRPELCRARPSPRRKERGGSPPHRHARQGRRASRSTLRAA